MLLLENRIHGLDSADLRPKEREYIERNANLYTNFVTLLRDGFTSTVAYRIIPFGRGKKKRELLFVKEVHRWIAKTDEHYVADYFFRKCMSSDWQTIFCMKDLRKQYWWGSAELPRNGLEPWTDFKSGRSRAVDMGEWLCTVDELISFMRGNVHEYFGIETESAKHVIKRYYPWEFACFYRKNLPASEFFCKMGFPLFVFSSRICGLNKQKMKRFRKWICENGCAVTGDCGTYRKYTWQEILYMSNHGLSVAQHEAHKNARETVKAFEERCPIRIDEAKAIEINKYIQKQLGYQGTNYYIDYLEMKVKYGQGDLKDYGTWFPRDLQKQHDSLQLLKNAEKCKKIDEGIAETIKKLNLPREKTFKDGFSLQVLSTSQSMVDVGKELEICVGSCGYNERFAKGKCVILKLTKDGKTMNCIELTPPNGSSLFQTVQNRGKNNMNSPCQPTSEKCVAAYIRAANKAYRNRPQA